MRFLRYVKSIVWELVLCISMVAGLGIPLMRWFYTEEPLGYTLLRLCFTALALLSVLYLGSYHRIALLLSALSAVAAILVLNLLLPVPGLLLIQNAAPALDLAFWYLVGILLALLLYLATLTPGGTAAVFFLGTVATGTLMLLGTEVPLWAFVLFLWSCASLYFFRRHEKLAMEEGSTPASLVVGTALFCGLCLLFGTLFWRTFIQPMDYQTRTLPFQQQSEVQASPSISPQETTTATPTPTPTPTSDQDADQEDPTFPDEAFNGTGDDGQAVASPPGLGRSLLLLLCVVLGLCYPNLRRWIWKKRLSRLSSEQQAQRCYLRLQHQLPYLGAPPVAANTPEGFAALVAVSCPWLEEVGRGWSQLTAEYCASLYGNEPHWSKLTDGLLHFRQSYYPACRKALGLRYLYLRYVLV